MADKLDKRAALVETTKGQVVELDKKLGLLYDENRRISGVLESQKTEISRLQQNQQTQETEMKKLALAVAAAAAIATTTPAAAQAAPGIDACRAAYQATPPNTAVWNACRASTRLELVRKDRCGDDWLLGAEAKAENAVHSISAATMVNFKSQCDRIAARVEGRSTVAAAEPPPAVRPPARETDEDNDEVLPGAAYAQVVVRRGSLSDVDAASLSRMSRQVLGPLPPGTRDSTTMIIPRGSSPAPGCRPRKTRHAGGGTWTRWICPLGTVRRGY